MFALDGHEVVRLRLIESEPSVWNIDAVRNDGRARVIEHKHAVTNIDFRQIEIELRWVAIVNSTAGWPKHLRDVEYLFIALRSVAFRIRQADQFGHRGIDADRPCRQSIVEQPNEIELVDGDALCADHSATH